MAFHKSFFHKRLFWPAIAIACAWAFFGIRLFTAKPSQGTFCSYGNVCFRPQGSVVVAYLSLSQIPAFLPWVQYWQESQRFEAVMIVPYEGLAVEEYYQQLQESHLAGLYVLPSLDSSPYGLYPMARSPAVYVISPSARAVGPIYRFDQV